AADDVVHVAETLGFDRWEAELGPVVDAAAEIRFEHCEAILQEQLSGVGPRNRETLQGGACGTSMQAYEQRNASVRLIVERQPQDAFDFEAVLRFPPHGLRVYRRILTHLR